MARRGAWGEDEARGDVPAAFGAGDAPGAVAPGGDVGAEAVLAGEGIGEVGEVGLEVEGSAEGGDGADQLDGGRVGVVLGVVEGELEVAVEGVAVFGPVVAAGGRVVAPALEGVAGGAEGDDEARVGPGAFGEGEGGGDVLEVGGALIAGDARVVQQGDLDGLGRRGGVGRCIVGRGGVGRCGVGRCGVACGVRGIGCAAACPAALLAAARSEEEEEDCGSAACVEVEFWCHRGHDRGLGVKRRGQDVAARCANRIERRWRCVYAGEWQQVASGGCVGFGGVGVRAGLGVRRGRGLAGAGGGPGGCDVRALGVG